MFVSMRTPASYDYEQRIRALPTTKGKDIRQTFDVKGPEYFSDSSVIRWATQVQLILVLLWYTTYLIYICA